MGRAQLCHSISSRFRKQRQGNNRIFINRCTIKQIVWWSPILTGLSPYCGYFNYTIQKTGCLIIPDFKFPEFTCRCVSKRNELNVSQRVIMRKPKHDVIFTPLFKFTFSITQAGKLHTDFKGHEMKAILHIHATTSYVMHIFRSLFHWLFCLLLHSLSTLLLLALLIDDIFE